MGYDRKRAIALKAADATELLKASLPFLFNKMTKAQIQQVQKVLDAAVVNPAVEKEANEIYRKSVRGQVGNQIVRDEKMVDKAYRVLAAQIPVNARDKRIQLDVSKLLTEDALTPRTDNPDEAAYLQAVKKALEENGVWLRLDFKLVRDPEEYGHWILDRRSFQVWLSFGPEGDAIPTKDGQLNREALMGTTAIGAGYWRNVHNGPVQRALEKQIKLLELQIEEGLEEHDRLIKRHRDAFPGVAEISDFVGGADLPSRSIWDHPHKLLVKALEARVGGNVSLCQPYLVVAAIVTRNNAQLLSQYADDSASGAGTIVSILRVAKTAGEIAEIGLTVVSGAGLVRAGVKAAGKQTASQVADKAVDAAAEKLVQQAIRKDPSLATDLAQVRWVPGPKGTVLGRGVKPNQSTGGGTGFQKWP
jgi:hypothetical protein